jgi:asparagine synthase (glutamine-hydrolysing)
VDLDGAPIPADGAAPLARAMSLLGVAPRPFAASGLAGVQLAHETPLDADRDLSFTAPNGDVLFGALRIDARDTLRRELAAAGIEVGAAASDAVLAWHAFSLWDDRCGEHLLGDFAFGVWQPTARRLVCVRDHHGNRQLYWGRDGARLVVASAIEGVRAHAPLASGFGDGALASYLQFGHVDDPERTTWRHVQRLPPAHTAVFAGSGPPRLRRYWAFPVPEPIRYRDGAQYVEHFLDVLGEAVRDRLREPAASILLSGGVDSTMLAATARAVAPRVTLHAQTMSYPVRCPSDEDALARMVATHLGVTHESVTGDDLIPLEWLDASAPYPAEPVDDPELGGLRRSYAALARHAPVTLFGEDGDTLLGPPTLLAQLRSRGAAEVARAWWGFWRTTGRRPWAGLDWRRRFRRALGRDADIMPWLLPSARAAAWSGEVPHPLRRRTVRLLTARLWDSLYQSIAPSHTGAATLPTLPLMDRRVIDFVFAIPSVPWGENKTLFRVAMRDRLPAVILDRPKTPLRGFYEARVAQWRASGGANVRLSERVAPWVDRARAEDILRHGDPLHVAEAWRTVILDRWLARMERPGA